MVDISRAIKAKIENLSNDNLDKARQKCQLAKLLLETATETRDNRLIGEAVEEYLQAIEIYSRLPEPYLAIAYISWIMGKPEDAVKLLNKVKEIDPQNKNAEAMSSQINEEKVSKLRSAVIKKHSDKAINEVMNKSGRKGKTDIFSKLSEMFSISPKNSSNKLKQARKPAARTGPLTRDDDFHAMLQQTRETMYKKEG
jgi:tetratricopeptide (TPR) repeat protein